MHKNNFFLWPTFSVGLLFYSAIHGLVLSILGIMNAIREIGLGIRDFCSTIREIDSAFREKTNCIHI